jgi:hypothetical protein
LVFWRRCDDIAKAFPLFIRLRRAPDLLPITVTPGRFMKAAITGSKRASGPSREGLEAMTGPFAEPRVAAGPFIGGFFVEAAFDGPGRRVAMKES